MKSAKWWMGLLTAVAAVLLVVPGARGAATVTDVEARQRYPWNGLVDITCKVTGIEGEATGLFTVVAVDGESGTVQDVSHVRMVKDGAESDDLTVAANGSYSLVWDARADLGEGQWSDMVVRVTVDALNGGQLWEDGPVWADRNIGAENPWDYGLYFWWGDTTGHRPSGTMFNFDFSYGNSEITTDRNDIATLQSEGRVVSKDDTDVLSPAHDAAHVQWGGDWRLPTEQELAYLCDKCDWTWAAMNGVNGYVVRGRGDYVANSIFLPAAGYGDGTSLDNAGSVGTVWSSVPDPCNSYSDAALLYFRSRYHPYYVPYYVWYHGRCYGFSIRPVRGFAE